MGSIPDNICYIDGFEANCDEILRNIDPETPVVEDDNTGNSPSETAPEDIMDSDDQSDVQEPSEMEFEQQQSGGEVFFDENAGVSVDVHGPNASGTVGSYGFGSPIPAPTPPPLPRPPPPFVTEPPCPYQGFEFRSGNNGLSASQLTEIAQTAVGEASNSFKEDEVENIIAIMQNMLTINVSYSNGQRHLVTYGKGANGKPVKPGTGGIDEILNEFDAVRSRSGENKVKGSLNDGVLPVGYVCSQLMEAIDYLSKNTPEGWNGTSMRSRGVTQNRGKGAYKKNVSHLHFAFSIGDKWFFWDERNR